MKVLKIKGTITVGSSPFYSGRTVNLSGLIAVTNSECVIAGQRVNRCPDCIHCVYFDINNRLHVRLPECTIVEATLADSEESKSFIEKLAKANLYYSDNDELLIKASDKVKFIVNGLLLTREELLSVTLPNGQAFNYRWINGYDYIGSEPVTREQFLLTVDKVLNNYFTFGEHCGILITDASQYGEAFAINVCIGSDKSYSEVSFS